MCLMETFLRWQFYTLSSLFSWSFQVQEGIASTIVFLKDSNKFIFIEKGIISIPPLTKFALTALAIFVGWQLVYDLYILPNGKLDEFLSLSGVTIASKILSLMGFAIESKGRIIGCIGARAVEINNGCNGLQLFGMFSGFIVSYPGIWKNRFILLATGSVVLFFANALRIAFFAVFNSIFPEHWNLAHDTSSYIFFYPVVLTFWYICTQMSSEDSLLDQLQT